MKDIHLLELVIKVITIILFVSPECEHKRILICKRCDSIKKDPTVRVRYGKLRCSICNAIIVLRARYRFRKCPLKKWK